MKNLHIALITSHFGFGGAQRVTVNLANELATRGHTVDLLVVDSSGNLKNHVDERIKQIELNPKGSHFSLPKLCKYLWKKQPDILLSGLRQINVLSAVATTLTRPKTKLIITEHSVPTEDSVRSSRSTKLAKYTYSAADKIVAVSEDVLLEMKKIYYIGNVDIEVIHNPVLGSDFENKRDSEPVLFDFDKYAHTILGAGRLDERKDFGNLISAYERVEQSRDVHLLILGDGPERENLRRISEEEGVRDSVTFAGFVENPFTYMNHSSVFVLSSLTEGFPSVLVEAMACGTPVVATNCSNGVKKILENGKYGPIVPIQDSDSLADAIVEVIDDPAPTCELRRQAKKYTSEKVADNYEQMFQSLLN